MSECVVEEAMTVLDALHIHRHTPFKDYAGYFLMHGYYIVFIF